MFIKNLEIENFKTVDQKETITFDRGLNVIMGANGTGKSNLLDSIYFVFGKKDDRVENNAHFFNKNNKSGKSVVKVVTDDNKTFERNLIQDASGSIRSTYYVNGEETTKEDIEKYLEQINTLTMDNPDASMNTEDIEDYARELKNRTKDNQIIIISHRKPIIEKADKVIEL